MKSIVFIVAMALSIQLSAQDWSSDVYKMGEQYPGYVINEAGKKIEGFIKYQNRYAMQNEVLFFAEKGNKKTKTKYKTADLKEYMVADKVYHCIHYSGGLLKKPVRANLLVQSGCINQYVWYERAENYATMQRGSQETVEDFMNRKYPSTMVFLKDGEEEVKSLDKFALKFKAKMSEYVSDNKELSSKVANGEKGYGMLRIMEIIAEYNEACEK